MQNLWPDDLDSNEANEPLSIIDEQAQFLGQKTKNVVTAKLSSTLSQTDEEQFFSTCSTWLLLYLRGIDTDFFLSPKE